MKHQLFRLFFLFALSFSTAIHAVTLGQPRVLSFLGQPLEVEIDLVGLEPGQQQDLTLSMPSDRQLERLGLLHTEFLDALTYDIGRSGDRWVAHIRTNRPVTEPFLDLALQLSWRRGQLTQQYTLLLEPDARRQSTRATQKRRATPGSTHLPAGRHTDTYGPVRRGEILTAVAQRLKPDGITTWQMSIVLYRANPDAFTNGNINKLRVGAFLAIPPLDVIETLDNSSAIAEFAAETTRWRTVTKSFPRAASTSKEDLFATAPKTEITAAKPLTGQKPIAQMVAEEPSVDAQPPVTTDRGKVDAIPDDQQHPPEQPPLTVHKVEAYPPGRDAIETRLARTESQLAHLQKLLEFKSAQIAAMHLENAALRVVRAADPPATPSPARATAAVTRAADRSIANASPSTLVTVQQPGSLLSRNLPTTVAPWYDGYLWVTWVMLGLVALSGLFMFRHRSEALTEEGFVSMLPEAGGNDSSVMPGIEQARPAAKINVALRASGGLRELPVNGTIVEILQDLPEAAAADIPTSDAADEGSAGPANDIADTGLLEGEDPPRSEPGSRAEPKSDISDAELEIWAAQLAESIEQADDAEPARDMGKAAAPMNQDDTIELVDDLPEMPEIPSQSDQPDQPIQADVTPLQLDEEFPGTWEEHGEPWSAEVPVREPIPVPLELESADDPPGDSNLSDQIGLVALADEDEDHGLNMQLARAYLEIGDQEGAREILRRALAGTPDPDPRFEMEELLSQIG